MCVYIYVSSCLHRYIAREGGGCGWIAYIRSSLVGHVPCCSQAFQCVCGQPGAASVRISEVPVKPQDTGVGSEDTVVRRWGGCRICCGCVAAAEPYQFCNAEKVGAVHGAMGQ